MILHGWLWMLRNSDQKQLSQSGIRSKGFGANMSVPPVWLEFAVLPGETNPDQGFYHITLSYTAPGRVVCDPGSCPWTVLSVRIFWRNAKYCKFRRIYWVYRGNWLPCAAIVVMMKIRITDHDSQKAISAGGNSGPGWKNCDFARISYSPFSSLNAGDHI